MQSTSILCALTLILSAPAAWAATQEIPRADSPDGDPVGPITWLVDPAEVEGIVRGTTAITESPAGTHGGSESLGAGSCAPFSTSELFTGVQPEGDLPSGVAFSPDGTLLVVSHTLSQNLVVRDAATRVVQSTIALSGSPQDVAISSDGVHAVTANIWEDTASIVNLLTGVELAVVPIGNQPGGVRISPDGTKAVVSNTVDLSMSVIDIASATELHRIAGAGFAATIALTPENGVQRAGFSGFEFASNSIVVLPDFGNDEIDFFDIVAGTVSSVASTPRPRGIDISADGNTAVIAHYFPETKISVVNVATQSVTKVIDLGTEARGRSRFVPMLLRRRSRFRMPASSWTWSRTPFRPASTPLRSTGWRPRRMATMRWRSATAGV